MICRKIADRIRAFFRSDSKALLITGARQVGKTYIIRECGKEAFESFIEINVAVEGEMLRFSCRNSKAERPNEEKGGVGLANIRKRLDLLYDHHYTLHIDDTSDVYSVELTLPLQS